MRLFLSQGHHHSCALAAGSTKVFRSLLLEVGATDAATFTAIVTGIIGVTSISGYIPARRDAASIALRTE